MKKITYLIASLLLMSMVFSMVGCSSETTDTSSDGNINVPEEVSNTPDPSEESDNAAPSNSTPENDTAAGLKVIKIDSTDTSLTEEQKAVVEYFDTDYLNVYNYEAMRRYPQIFDGSQVSVIGSVLKVVSMDAEQYQLVLWMDVGDLGMGAWLPEQYQGAYLLLTGKTGEEWFMEGDILDVYGRSNGVETVNIDGTSYTIPKIEVQRAYQAQADVRDGLIGVYTSYKFDLPFIKQVAETIFGKDIEIRKPVIGTDVTEENAMLLQDVGMDITEDRFVVELENQSNANFSRFLFPKSGGMIQSIESALSFDSTDAYDRYLEFAADFQHFFLFTYDQGLEMLTLAYYDKDLNKIWEREFMETTSAQYDFTENNIYLTANNQLYIINTSTGEDTYSPAYVGSKVAVRKCDDGILMISSSRSDGVMMANLDGSVKWTANLEHDVDSVEGLQVVDDRIIFCYEWYDEAAGFGDTYVALDRESGEMLVSATPA